MLLKKPIRLKDTFNFFKQLIYYLFNRINDIISIEMYNYFLNIINFQTFFK